MSIPENQKCVSETLKGIRSLIVTGIRQVIAIEGHRSSSTLSTAALGAMREQTHQMPSANNEQVTKNSQKYGLQRQ